MKTFLSVIMLVLIASAAFSKPTGRRAATQKPVTAIGYLVAVTSPTKKLEITKTIDLADVYTLAEIHFQNNCVDFAEELRHSVYYDIECQQKGFYVEVKNINRNGKFRRMSNREFRQLKIRNDVGID